MTEIRNNKKMLRHFILMSLGIFLSTTYAEMYWPSRGLIWPKPLYENNTGRAFVIDPCFHIDLGNNFCTILKHAASRYLSLCKRQVRPNYNASGMASVQYLKIEMFEPCNDTMYPYLDMDESYNLTVSNISVLTANSVWGVLRGLETFSQLMFFDDDCKLVILRETTIRDRPLYPYRGLMLDSSLYYISVKTILTTLEAMAINKMNVFHWHIVDNESFPYQSDKFPELSAKGALANNMVYTKQDIKHIVEHARERGIRVIPEFRVPERCHALGLSHPEIIEPCDGSLNPILKRTYKFLQELFSEVQERFPDKAFHLGGNDLNLICWWIEPKKRRFISTYNLKDEHQLLGMFQWYVEKLLKPGTKPIYWQGSFEYAGRLPNRTMIQVSRYYNGLSTSIQVLKAGNLLIQSWMYNLSEYKTFEDYYIDPSEGLDQYITKKDLLNNVLGGEALMLGDGLDDTIVVRRTWPKASAIAERLWSNITRGMLDKTYHRIEEQTCRMIRRGINIQPIFGYRYCHVYP